MHFLECFKIINYNLFPIIFFCLYLCVFIRSISAFPSQKHVYFFLPRLVTINIPQMGIFEHKHKNSVVFLRLFVMSQNIFRYRIFISSVYILKFIFFKLRATNHIIVMCFFFIWWKGLFFYVCKVKVSRCYQWTNRKNGIRLLE